jgi:hypothetical protein
MLREDRSQQSLVEMSGTIERAQKLQALKDENSYLEQHLAAMVLDNRVLQSIRSKKASFKF